MQATRKARLESVMKEELSALIWKAHPYRWPVIGYMEDIRAASLPMVSSFFSRFYAPNNAVLVVAGPGDRRDDDLRDIARAHPNLFFPSLLLADGSGAPLTRKEHG
mgnify:CR=1 FL=1